MQITRTVVRIVWIAHKKIIIIVIIIINKIVNNKTVHLTCVWNQSLLTLVEQEVKHATMETNNQGA